MPIIYSLVSYKGALRAEATTPGLTGNFGHVAKLLVQKLPTTNSKLSYIYDEYMFHYIIDHHWVYLCICDKNFQRMLAFQFLNGLVDFVKDPEAMSNGSSTLTNTTSLTPAVHSTLSAPLQNFLVQQMEKYNVAVTDAHHKIYSDISTLKDTMVQNIETVLERGERIDLLVDKSDALHESSFVFKRGSKRLRDEMWWKNTKLLLAIAGGFMVTLAAENGEA